MVTVREFIADEKLYYSDSFILEPIVSVILPTYCRGDNGLLKRTIDLVLEQTFVSFELIIVDDGSVDSTQALVSEYLHKDHRILYIRNDCNSGLPAVRVNQGILHARGKYIAYQFDDDCWKKDALELLVHEIEKYKELTLVYGQWEYYDVKQKVSGLRKEKFDFNKLVSENYIANNSVIHHKEICDKYGMYDCSLIMRRLCDWDLWLRWAKEIQFVYLDKVVSLIEMNVDNSLGTTVTYDLLTSRIFFSEYRNELLTPLSIQDYEIDSTRIIINDEHSNKIYNTHMLPWKLRHIDRYLNENIYMLPDTKKQRIIVTKLQYDSTVSIMIENFVSLQPKSYQLIYIPEEQLQYNYLLDGDMLLLCRATTQTTFNIVKRIKTEGRKISVLYFIDDDLLNIYKLGEEFSYISPGTAMYVIVEKLLSMSDIVVAFSQSIAKTVSKYNKCISILKTNVLSKYIADKGSYNEGEVFNIIFMGGGARKEEFSAIQDDLVRICEKYKDKVSFTFMGFIPEKMKDIKESKVTFIEYTLSYYQYLNRLSSSNYNLLLCPLHNNDFKRGKSPVKLLEACCCGAIGLYSDISVYSCIEDKVQGYKIKTGDSWFDKIDQIIGSSLEEKKKIFSQAVTLAERSYATEKNLPEFELAIKTAKLANLLQKKDIMYVCHSAYLAGAENHLFRHCLLAKQAGFNVIFALPSSAKGQLFAMEKMAKDNDIEVIFLNYINNCEIEDINRNQAIEMGEGILHILDKREIALIHSCTLIPAVGYVADKLNIPYIASLYATESDYICENPNNYYMPDFIHSDSVMYANKWQGKSDRVSRCIRSYIPNEFFNTRESKAKTVYRIAISGTLQERKRQKELIAAIGMLKGEADIELYLFGYDHFFPEYKTQCIEMASKYGIENNVIFKGLVTNMHDSLNELNIDIAVCASIFESFPQVILEAMALEIPVISTPVAGVPELILNGKTGFVSTGFEAKDISLAIQDCIKSIENKTINQILKNAKATIERECSLVNVSYQLFDVYLESFSICNKKNMHKRLSNVMKDNGLVIDYNRNNRIIEPEVVVYSKGLTKKRSYNISCEVNKLTQLGIIFSSPELCPGGRVIMNLYNSGRLVRKSEMSIDDIKLDNWNYFIFNTIYGTGGKIFTVELIFEYIDPSRPIGVYEDKRNRTFLYKVFNKLNCPINGMNTLYVDCKN